MAAAPYISPVDQWARERGFVTNPMGLELLGIDYRKRVIALVSKLVGDKRLVSSGNTRARRCTLSVD